MKPSVILVAVWLVLSAAHLGLSLRSDPGVYYDEVIQANPTRDYLRGYRRTTPPPQVTSIEVFGRPFPWMTQPYMGALKSQWLIPPFAIFGATPEVLRATTTLWALLAILVAMLWMHAVFGLGPACALGALLSFDPTWLFVARHDWGSVSLAMLLRMAALVLALRAWQTDRAGAALAAGLAAGLAVYNKVDAAPFMVAVAAGLLAAQPAVLRSLLSDRWRLLAWGALGSVVGALPLIVTAQKILAASGYLSENSGLAMKTAVALGTLDGSYFYRLIDAYGGFTTMWDRSAPDWELPLVFAASFLVLVVQSFRGRADPVATGASRFLVVAWLVTQGGLLATPAADRVHHALNVYPLPHLVVIAAGTILWRGFSLGTLPHRVVRGGLVLALTAGVASGVWVIDKTADLIERSGGRGLWSDASTALAEEFDRPETTFVCLDWGFHQTLAFQTEEAKILDAIWRLRVSRQGGKTWSNRGGAGHVYLIHLGKTDVTRFGSEFMAAVEAVDPERVEVRSWKDREGVESFRTVRFLGKHVLTYDDGFAFRRR